ncbi:helix-turn-helix domain-containing protein [Taibaiella soli]|uniref:HTH araC/xylS-type domain-containing protein n=1 Tax=Taibaiella soli TaxID=1649169 RepID=A0A2W2BDR7_9BACT|nr:helix-turn-helix domain-containing protein [Taibaiella soli]PZF71736.1 hypothetical protein DN068_16860 [Taibaiella soli]
MDINSKESNPIHLLYAANKNWLKQLANTIQDITKHPLPIPEHALALPTEIGTGKIWHWNSSGDIALTYWDCKFNSNVQVQQDELEDWYSICCFFSYEHVPAREDRSFTVFFDAGQTATEHFMQSRPMIKVMHILIRKSYFVSHIARRLPENQQQFSGKMLINKDLLVALTQFVETVDKNQDNKLFIEGKTFHFLSLFLDLYIQKKSSKKRYLTDIEQLMTLNGSMEQKCFEDLMTVSEMADTLHMSVTKFKQLFTEVYDTTYLQYHIHQRLLAAQEMLRQPKVRMGEVALKTGYSGISHFAKAYKKHFGHSPVEYHKEYLKLVENNPA